MTFKAGLERLEDRVHLSIGLVTDINQADANPRDLTASGSTLYFLADDANGTGLWKSNGTTAGTVKVTSITPYFENFGGSVVAAVAGTVYVEEIDPRGFGELFKSDGTTAGTTLVTRIDGFYSGLTAAGKRAFFIGVDGKHGVQLWASDGTTAGTLPVTGFSKPYAYVENDLTPVGGKVLFTADDGTHGVQLWVSDGTAAGTMMLTNSQEFSPLGLTTLNGTAYFQMSQEGARTLWKSDGTLAGTKELSLGTIEPTGPRVMGALDGSIEFVGRDASNPNAPAELYRTDGTAAGTIALTTGFISDTFFNPNAVAGSLVFEGVDDTHGRELWRSDGTPSGTGLLKDINPGPVSSLAPPDIGPGTAPVPTVMTVAGGAAYFAADDGTHGQELWKTDGTTNGTQMVTDLNPGAASSSPHELTNVGGTLYFVAHDGNGASQLWKTSGTTNGTVLVRSFSPAETRSANPQALTPVGASVYFTADDGIHGRELWKTDGTAAGTNMVADLNPGPDSSNPSSLVALNGALYFTASTAHNGLSGTTSLYRSDGTTSGTVPIYSSTSLSSSDPLIVIGPTIYFTTREFDPATFRHYFELWKSDGTPAGTNQVASIDGGTYSSATYLNPTDVGGTLYFTVSVGSARPDYTQLWRSDGTASGTIHVTNLTGGQYTHGPSDLNSVGGKLVFTLPDPDSAGVSLWKSDGTAAGTVAFEDFRDQMYNGQVHHAAITAEADSGGKLFLSIIDGTGTSALGVIDGTTNGITWLAPVNEDPEASPPADLTDVNGELFFAATDPVNQFIALWKSEGTKAGTTMVTDLPQPAPGGPYYPYALPGNFVNNGGTLYFSYTFSDESGLGVNLWKSDGTAAGTVALQGSVLPGARGFVTANGMIEFVAYDDRGLELWSASDLAPVGGTGASVNVGPNATVPVDRVFTRAGSFTDPGGTSWTATVDYGDGTGPEPLALTADNRFLLGHIYQVAGDYTVTVTVKDDKNGGGSAWFVTQAFAAPAAPVLDASTDTGISQSDGITRNDGSFSSPLIFDVSNVRVPGAMIRLYEVTNPGPPVLLAGPTPVVNGKVSLTLNTRPFSPGDHRFAVTATTDAFGPETALSSPTSVSIWKDFHVLSSNPADGGHDTALPGGQISITVEHPVAGLSNGGPAISSKSPFSVYLVPRGPDGTFNAPTGLDSGSVPIHADTTYRVNTDGTATITVQPTQPLSSDVYGIGFDLSKFVDLAGNPLASLEGGFQTYLLQPPPVTTSPLRVTGVTEFNGFAAINNNRVYQPDTIAIAFNKPLFAGVLAGKNSSAVQLIANPGPRSSVVKSAAAYSPTTRTIYLTPEAPLNPGTVYVIRVDGSVSDDQGYGGPGYPLGQTFYDSFMVINPLVQPGQAPLRVATTSGGAPATMPEAGSFWTSPLGYASVQFTQPVSLAYFDRFSAMLVPQKGGFSDSAFDSADMPLNAKLAFNPNTNQLIMVPTQPVGNDLYLIELGRINAALSDGTPNPADPLMNNAGQAAGVNGPPYFATFQLQVSAGPQSIRAASASVGLAIASRTAAGPSVSNSAGSTFVMTSHTNIQSAERSAPAPVTLRNRPPQVAQGDRRASAHPPSWNLD